MSFIVEFPSTGTSTNNGFSYYIKPLNDSNDVAEEEEEDDDDDDDDDLSDAALSPCGMPGFRRLKRSRHSAVQVDIFRSRQQQKYDSSNCSNTDNSNDGDYSGTDDDDSCCDSNDLLSDDDPRSKNYPRRSMHRTRSKISVHSDCTCFTLSDLNSIPDVSSLEMDNDDTLLGCGNVANDDDEETIEEEIIEGCNGSLISNTLPSSSSLLFGYDYEDEISDLEGGEDDKEIQRYRKLHQRRMQYRYLYQKTAKSNNLPQLSEPQITKPQQGGTKNSIYLTELAFSPPALRKNISTGTPNQRESCNSRLSEYTEIIVDDDDGDDYLLEEEIILDEDGDDIIIEEKEEEMSGEIVPQDEIGQQAQSTK